MHLIKLDKRHSGGHRFRYSAVYTRADYKEFCAQRQWCWETWGPSVELEFYDRVETRNAQWAWVNDQFKMRICLAGEKEASHYLLRWGDK
jgi:hypothetical protein